MKSSLRRSALSPVLQNTANTTSHQQDINNGNSFGNSEFLMFLTLVVVILVVLLYVICMIRMVRSWYCKGGVVDEPTHLVMDDRVFELTPDQRRAVLEVVFSATGEVINEADVGDRKERRKGGNSDESSERSVDDASMGVEVATLKEEHIEDRELVPPEVSAVPNSGEGQVIPISPLSIDAVDHESVAEKRRKEESETSSVALLSEPVTFTRINSIVSACKSEFDDETSDNVCPICLNTYQEKDILITSKRCSHLFHKACVLEWLEKHDSCPVCRMDMITEHELNQAATNIVGQTRMYMAVQSMRSKPQHVAQNPGTQRHVLPAHRRIIPAALTPPPSPPRRLRLEY